MKSLIYVGLPLPAYLGFGIFIQMAHFRLSETVQLKWYQHIDSDIMFLMIFRKQNLMTLSGYIFRH